MLISNENLILGLGGAHPHISMKMCSCAGSNTVNMAPGSTGHSMEQQVPDTLFSALQVQGRQMMQGLGIQLVQ